ncbi:YcnI family protein [Anoxybacteroides tepidamans]|uniref:YcnI family copper-binding membrane protein n=1 Tax=Anoxybacteroides tepidamans TaxID=265948 RepID=UPI0009FFFD8A|nr:YcnI family protein [Anoxybacillus tepidamans]
MKKAILRTSRIMALTMAAFLLFAGMASAHVTVKPNMSAPGAWETYTIKIPVEKDVPTVKVTLKIPEGAEFVSYQPADGWKVTMEKDASGKVKTVTWEATGAGLLPGQFQQFDFMAKNPEKEGTLAWDAYQYYKDGSIVEWTGNEKSQTPHSVTEISQSAATADSHDTHHDHQAAQKENAKEETTANQSGTNGMQTATLIVSIASLILSLIALFKRK